MSNLGFEFISHESFPEDPYTCEAVVFCIDGKHRVTYLRKKLKTGAMFWDVMSAGVKQHGETKYLKSYSQDSNFLAEDIKHFLEARSWEPRAEHVSMPSSAKVESNEDSLAF